MQGVLSYDERLRRVCEDLRLEKKNCKLVVKEAEKLACCVHDLGVD